jgi:hypothetical protein
MDEKVKELLINYNLLNDEQSKRLSKSLFEITFSFCLNALVYNKSLKSKIKEFWSVINDKRISRNTKIFTIKDIPSSTSKINGSVKIVCFFILKYLR